MQTTKNDPDRQARITALRAAVARERHSGSATTTTTDHPVNQRAHYLQSRFLSIRAEYHDNLQISPEEKRAVKSREMQILYLSLHSESEGVSRIVEKYGEIESFLFVKDYPAAVDLALFTLQAEILKAQK